MYDECYMGEDDRDLEADLDRAEAEGKFRRVTVRVTLQTTIDLPANVDLSDFLDEHTWGGEIINGEEV